MLDVGGEVSVGVRVKVRRVGGSSFSIASHQIASHQIASHHPHRRAALQHTAAQQCGATVRRTAPHRYGAGTTGTSTCRRFTA